MQARRSASEKQRRRRMVNQRFLTAMAEMGIPGDRAELALAETGNVGVEACAPLPATSSFLPQKPDESQPTLFAFSFSPLFRLAAVGSC